MNICHVAIGHRPYDERIYYKQCWSIRNWAEQVTIIAREHDESADRYPEIQIRHFKPSGSLQKDLQRIKQICIEIQADIYHLHEPELLLLLPSLRRKTGAAVIYDMHEPTPEVVWDFSHTTGYKRLPLALIYGVGERIALPHLDGAIFTSKTLYNQLNHSVRQSTIIYNFPRLDLFSSPHSPSSKEFTIVYIGQIARPRGILQLLAGFHHWYRQGQQGRLHLVGRIQPPEFRSILEQYIKRYRISHAVRIVDSLPHNEIPEMLSRASVGIMALLPIPSFRKSVQLKTFEYMSAGLPVIAGNYPSAHQFVGSQKAGIILENTTPQTIADALRYLYTHPEERRKMGRRGQKAVRERWNWSVMDKRLRQFYLTVSARKSHRK